MPETIDEELLIRLKRNTFKPSYCTRSFLSRRWYSERIDSTQLQRSESRKALKERVYAASIV
jgi:hypothetical protein